jgi:hypothetical protein
MRNHLLPVGTHGTRESMKCFRRDLVFYTPIPFYRIIKENEYSEKMKTCCTYIQWNPGNTTNHGTDVGWSCYGGGRVNEVENLGVNFLPTKYGKTAYRIACLHEVMHEAIFIICVKLLGQVIYCGTNVGCFVLSRVKCI